MTGRGAESTVSAIRAGESDGMTDERRSRGQIEDARGKWVRPLDPVKLYLLRRHDLIPADALRGIAEDLDRPWVKIGRALFVFYAVMLMMCWGGMTYYLLFLSRSRRLDGVMIAFYGLQLVFMCAAFFVPWFISSAKRLPYVRPAMLKHRRCPRCAYDLRGLSADPRDGATACPECGCAWRINAPEVMGFSGEALRRMNRPTRRAQALLGILALLLLGGALFGYLSNRRARLAQVRSAPAPTAAVPPASVPSRGPVEREAEVSSGED